MSKLSELTNIMKGHRAIKRVQLPLVNVPSSLIPDVPELAAQRQADAAGGEPAKEITVGLRVLTLSELTTIYEKAGEFARKHGVKDPNETDPVYALGLSVYTCAIACVDPDSDVKDPEPFFGKRGDIESAALELLDSIHIGRDGIAYLAEQHENWQDICNPQANKVPPHAFYDAIYSMATNDIDQASKAFLAFRPGSRLLFAIFMANLLKSLLPDKFSLGVYLAEINKNG